MEITLSAVPPKVKHKLNAMARTYHVYKCDVLAERADEKSAFQEHMSAATLYGKAALHAEKSNDPARQLTLLLRSSSSYEEDADTNERMASTFDYGEKIDAFYGRVVGSLAKAAAIIRNLDDPKFDNREMRLLIRLEGALKILAPDFRIRMDLRSNFLLDKESGCNLLDMEAKFLNKREFRLAVYDLD